VGGRKLPPELVEAVLGYLAAGLNPIQAARAAGVGRTVAYNLDRRVRGVSRLDAKRDAAARRAAERAARQQAAAGRVRALTDLLTAGMSPNQAGPAAGVSTTFAYELDRKMGGVYRPPGTTYSDRYLDREERYEIARGSWPTRPDTRGRGHTHPDCSRRGSARGRPHLPQFRVISGL
jgi:hypothetical protein